MQFGPIRTATAALALGLAGIAPAAAQEKVSLLLDWGWLPYHTVFLLAQDRGFYKDAGLDLKIEQGRGSANAAVVVGQGNFDLGHINITNAAQAIAKGVPLKVIAVPTGNELPLAGAVIATDGGVLPGPPPICTPAA